VRGHSTSVLVTVLLLLMTFSPLLMSNEPVRDDAEELQPASAEQVMYVSNNNPMSTIHDAVSFYGAVNSTIRGHSSGANSSIATGRGGGDGNHWWRTPVIGERFTVNASIESWNTNYSSPSLRIAVHTNQGRCQSFAVYWSDTGNQSRSCTSPQSGGFAYISVSFEVNINYAEVDYRIEVAEYIVDQTTTEYEYPDGDLGADSTLSNPVTLDQGMSVTGTLEQGWYTDDYIHLLQGLNTVHRVNVTVTGFFGTLSVGYQSLGDCNYYSIDLLSGYLDCRVTGSNPIVKISPPGSAWQSNNQNWTASYTLEQINPIEDELYGDIYNTKYIASDTVHSGSVEGNWDTQDDYAIIIEHGHEMKFDLFTDANITVRIPSQERCNSGDVTDIMVQARMPLALSCTTTHSFDVFRISLIPMTSEVATYTIVSRAGDTQSDAVCCENDAGTGGDAPPTYVSEHAITLPLGTSNGSFIHVTDTVDVYHIDIPPSEGRIVFIQGNSVEASGWETWTSQGDLLYSIVQNTGDVTITQAFDISPLALQSNTPRVTPEVYAPQNYSISVHSFSAPDLTWEEHSASHFPAYLGEGSSFSIPEYTTADLSMWRLLSASSTYSKTIALEFDPTTSLRITAVQASGETVHLAATGSTGWNFEDTEITLAKWYDWLSIVREWHSVRFNGLDGSELTVSVTQPALTTSSKEENMWIATSGAVWGRLGTSFDEGFDTEDYWTVTLNSAYSFQLSLQVMDGLQAQLSSQSSLGTSYDSMVIGGCLTPGSSEPGAPQNFTFLVNHISGSGRYNLDLELGESCSTYSTSLIPSASQRRASPGESIYLYAHSYEEEELDEGNLSFELYRPDGFFVTELPVEHFGELLGYYWNYHRDIRVGIPNDIDEGSYFVRLLSKDIIIDSMSMDILPGDDVSATTAISVLGPGDAPRWLVDVHSPASSAPQEWDFSLNETWMREVDGTPVVIDSVEVSTPTTESGIGLVETLLPWQPRPGSVIFQTCTISTPSREPGIEAAEVVRSAAWSVGLIDLTQGAAQGRGPYTPSHSWPPTNDLFITISASLTTIPAAGVSGAAEVYDSEHNLLQSHPFITDGWGEGIIRVDYSQLAADNYTVELTADDGWSDWVEMPEVFVFEILSASDEDSPDATADERSLSLTAAARRDTLVAGETITIDWSVVGGQPLNVLEWSLLDSAGRVLAVDTTTQIGQTEGVLLIAIPDSLDVSLQARVLLTATGVYGSESSVLIYIDNLEDDTELIVNVKPNLARPGDTLTVSMELDSDVDYLYWRWTLYEGGSEIVGGEDWEAATEVEFTIVLDQRDMQNLVLYIIVVDGEGTMHQKSVTIELHELVELSVESAFYTNAGDPLPLEWGVTSPSLTNADEATSITIQLIQMGTGTVAYEASHLVGGYDGGIDVLIPLDTRPGTYVLFVQLATVGGSTLSSQSLIDVHEPREKNIILGMELPPWSSIIGGLASTLLILNLVAIWMVLFIGGRRRRAASEEGSETEDDQGSGLDDIEDDIGFELQSQPLSGHSTHGLQPSVVLSGEIQDDGHEWLEHPAGSNVWWYRASHTHEWSRTG